MKITGKRACEESNCCCSVMVTALYNAPITINHFYQQEVQHDMYGGGWDEKGIV